jgi:intracellular sulfur oxidation DsrE/DsrF family protein
MNSYTNQFLVTLLMMFALTAVSNAAEPLSPWGAAPELSRTYSKQKVVFDVHSSSIDNLISVLDRASYISQLNGADPFDSKIVLVLHGGAIPFFASKNYAKYTDLMKRAQSLSVGGIIEYRMCKIAARAQGFSAKDIHGFVSMVPMGDAEIIQLQQEGYAYMQ